MRISPHICRSASVALTAVRRARRLKKSPTVRCVEVVVVRLLLQLREHAFRVLVGPVREQHDVFAVVREWLRLARLDDERAVEPALLLEARVAVIPVGAVLLARRKR